MPDSKADISKKVNMTIPGFYTLTQAAAHLKMSKDGAAKVAKVEGWQFHQVGNVHLCRAVDVHEYRDHRQRTQLTRKLGWRYPGPGQGLYRNNDIDIECPICGAFAIEWPAPPELPKIYLCLKGHEGELE